MKQFKTAVQISLMHSHGIASDIVCGTLKVRRCEKTKIKEWFFVVFGRDHCSQFADKKTIRAVGPFASCSALHFDSSTACAEMHMPNKNVPTTNSRHSSASADDNQSPVNVSIPSTPTK
jgi:hypothetical protein